MGYPMGPSTRGEAHFGLKVPGTRYLQSVQSLLKLCSQVLFEDIDDRAGWVAGTAVIRRSLDESDVSKYVLYWGATKKLKVLTFTWRLAMACHGMS